MRREIYFVTIICLLFGAFLFFSACNDSKNDPDGNDISFSVLEENDSSNYVLVGDYEMIEEPMLLTFYDETAFYAFWDRHKAGSSEKDMHIPESIDFEEFMVIVLFDRVESESGYSIKIESLTEIGGEIVVNGLKTTIDGPECAHLQVLTHPFSIVKTVRTEKGIVLSLEEVTKDCFVESEDNIEFTTLEKREYCNYPVDSDAFLEAPIMLTFDSEAEFSEFWVKLTWHDEDYYTQNFPQVDFDEEIILIVIDQLEYHTGYAIEIERLIDTGETIEVHAKKISIPESCAADDSETQPYEMIKIRRTEKSFVLSLEEVTKDDCDPFLSSYWVRI